MARRSLENVYRTLATPRHRIGPFVRQFALSGRTRDPRADLWAALPATTPEAVRAAWRALAEGPRAEAVVTPQPAPLREAGAVGERTVVVEASRLLPF